MSRSAIARRAWLVEERLWEHFAATYPECAFACILEERREHTWSKPLTARRVPRGVVSHA